MKTKTDTLRRTVYTPGELHVRESAEGHQSRTIEGYAILFDTPSAVLWEDEEREAREEIAPEAITRELLDGCDIKFTMFHDRQLILARSNKGAGTLGYEVDERGVKFTFDAPDTADGEKALSMVRRGDVSGCSFAFVTRYLDRDCVERSCKKDKERERITYRVKKVLDVLDFTLAADPAYPATTVSARELEGEAETETANETPDTTPDLTKMREQVAQMRQAAARKM